jgi:hypothetical protein
VELWSNSDQLKADSPIRPIIPTNQLRPIGSRGLTFGSRPIFLSDGHVGVCPSVCIFGSLIHSVRSFVDLRCPSSIAPCQMSRFVQLPVPVGRRVGSALSGSATASASVVSKTPRRNIPQDALSNPHHVTRNGKLVRFKNPYPSFSHDINPFIVARAMLW